MDARVTDLQLMVADFVHRRAWEQFHNPKDLAISISIEASELLEHFQWKNQKELESMIKDKAYKKKIEEEIADIFIYLLAFSNRLNIQLTEAVLEKIQKNSRRYPIEKARGTAAKYTDL
jgi:NTP pyrophosphatase (non-canonical NTP hydrolase)